MPCYSYERYPTYPSDFSHVFFSNDDHIFYIFLFFFVMFYIVHFLLSRQSLKFKVSLIFVSAETSVCPSGDCRLANLSKDYQTFPRTFEV